MATLHLGQAIDDDDDDDDQYRPTFSKNSKTVKDTQYIISLQNGSSCKGGSGM